MEPEEEYECPVCSGEGRRFFIDNASSDCQSCQILAGSLRNFYPPDGPRGKVLLMPIHFPDQSPKVQISSADDDGSPSAIVFHVTRKQDVETVARNVGGFFGTLSVRRDIEKVPSGRASVDQIHTWTRRCRDSHPKCQRETPPLPSRVIDVGTRGDGDDDVCKLYESHDGERGEYIALSHCWGKIRILTTLKKNIKAHKTSIKLDTLPKTFQEAIQTTRNLGIRYLWIDSLCIVQDDADDWAKESAMMASIYRNGYLTLAATAANDGSEGLFKPRKVDTYSHTTPDGATIHATKHRKHDCLRAVDDLSESRLGPLPLMTRAWCFQERILSSRILHFAADEMVWECQESTSCECSLLEDYPQQDWARLTGGDPIAQDVPDRTLFRLPDNERHWFRLIRSYTVLNITKDFDRLPALSGIASTLIPADEYMAGIRQSRALEDLLWSTGASPPPRRPEKKTYVAPSWSWASVMGNIMHAHPWNLGWKLEADISRGLAEVKSISTVKENVDLFGRVKSGELKIAGTYFKAVVREKPRSEIIGSTFGRHWLTLEIPDLPAGVWPKEPMLDTVEDAREMVGQSVRLLALWTMYGNVSFLILCRNLLVPWTFRRVGLAEMFPFVTLAGKAERLSVDEILDKGQKGEMTVV